MTFWPNAEYDARLALKPGDTVVRVSPSHKALTKVIRVTPQQIITEEKRTYRKSDGEEIGNKGV